MTDYQSFHNFVSAISDGGDTSLVRPQTGWNTAHKLYLPPSGGDDTSNITSRLSTYGECYLDPNNTYLISDLLVDDGVLICGSGGGANVSGNVFGTKFNVQSGSTFGIKFRSKGFQRGTMTVFPHASTLASELVVVEGHDANTAADKFLHVPQVIENAFIYHPSTTLAGSKGFVVKTLNTQYTFISLTKLYGSLVVFGSEYAYYVSQPDKLSGSGGYSSYITGINCGNTVLSDSKYLFKVVSDVQGRPVDDFNFTNLVLQANSNTVDGLVSEYSQHIRIPSLKVWDWTSSSGTGKVARVDANTYFWYVVGHFGGTLGDVVEDANGSNTWINTPESPSNVGSAFRHDNTIFDKSVSPVSEDWNLKAGEDFDWAEVGFVNTDGDVNLADATNASSSTGVEIVMCVKEAGILNTAKGRWLKEGGVRNDAWNWSSAGKPVYLTTTPGVISETPPANNIRIVGYTRDDDRLYFCPNNSFTP